MQTKGKELIEALKTLLEDEFRLLCAGSYSNLSDIQNKKSVLLEELSTLSSESEVNFESGWEFYNSGIEECRDMHRRNELLVTRKLHAAQGALQSLQMIKDDYIDQTYDRKGTVKGKSSYI